MQEIEIDTRLHPWRALRGLITVVRDPEKTDAGIAMVRAFEGHSPDRLMARILAHPMGARILAEERRLDRVLCDRDALEKLPPGSLGQSYAAWTRAEGISAEGLIGVTGCVNCQTDPKRQLLEARSAAAHDLWHVVTGYGRDLLGELALLHFTLIQTGNTGMILPCWLGMLAPSGGRAGRRLVFEARRRARRATWLPVADWEALLAEPLPTVRERLRVGRPPRYRPIYADSIQRSSGLATSRP